MWVSTKRIYDLVQICSNVFVLNDFFAKLVHGVSKSAVSAARILMDLLGWFLIVPPPKKKHETYQIFRIFLLDLTDSDFFQLFLGGRGLCHLEEMILKKAARGWLDIDLLWGPMTWLTGQRLNRLMGRFLEIPCHRRCIMWIIEVYYVLICIICGTGRSWIFSCWFFFFRTTLGHHNQELLGFFRILTGFDRSKATCSSFLAVSCLFWRACFCQHHGFTAPCFHFYFHF